MDCKETFAATSMASARNMARMDKLEISLNSLTEELCMQAKALDNFVRCFDLYLCHVLNVSIEIWADDLHTTIIQRFKPRILSKGAEEASPSAAGQFGASNPIP